MVNFIGRFNVVPSLPEKLESLRDCIQLVLELEP